MHDAEILADFQTCGARLLAVGDIERSVELGAGLLEPGERFVKIAAEPTG
jgi:hypothetical protein